MTWHNVEKLDKLDVLIGLAIKDLVDEETERYMNADVSGITFSNSYYRRKRQVINRHMMRKHIAVVKKVASRVAIVILCILSAAFITVMSVSALRNAIWETIVEWYDDYILIRFENIAEVTNKDTDEIFDITSVIEDTSQQPSVPTKILEYIKPQYVPVGVEEEVVLKSKGAYMIEYYLGDDMQCSYRQRVLNEDSKKINNENSVIYEMKINGNIVNVIDSEMSEEIVIVWEDGRYIYMLTSYMDLEETLKMVESIG